MLLLVPFQVEIDKGSDGQKCIPIQFVELDAYAIILFVDHPAVQSDLLNGITQPGKGLDCHLDIQLQPIFALSALDKHSTIGQVLRPASSFLGMPHFIEKYTDPWRYPGPWRALIGGSKWLMWTFSQVPILAQKRPR